MGTTNLLILIFSILGVTAIILFLVFRAVRNYAQKKQEELLQSPDFYHAELVEHMANFFGVRSKKSRQLRGNGLLAVTQTHLVFKMYMGSTFLKIPLQDILHVSSVKAFTGRTMFRPLLSIDYKTNEGEESAAWYVKDLAVWIAKLSV